MQLKTKIRLGLLTVFGFVTILGIIGSYYLDKVAQNSEAVLRDNYQTIAYTREMSLAMNDIVQTLSLENSSPEFMNRQLRTAIDRFRRYLKLEGGNATEQGELALIEEIRVLFAGFADQIYPYQPEAALSKEAYRMNRSIKKLLEGIYTANEAGIRRNAEEAATTVERIMLSMIIIALIFFVLAVAAMVYLPNLIARPFTTLTEGIQQISRRNYRQRLPVQSNDEIGQMATAFNQMAEKLDEYENLNLSQLFTEKRRTETIIQRMNDPILGMDAAGQVLFANERFLELVGEEEATLVGQHIDRVAARNELLANLIKEALPPDRIKSQLLQGVALDKEGERFYFNKEILVVDVEQPQGTPNSSGVVLILKNITQLKEKDMAKTNFLATLSHELKTPISAIDMSVRLLNDKRIGRLNEDQADMVETLGANSKRLLKMVNEILDISKIETGNLQLDFESARPEAVVERAVSNVQSLFQEKAVRLSRRIDEALPAMQLDVQKTSGVLINFLTNALRYSEAGDHVKVVVEREGPQLQFSVRDEGPGIPAVEQARIFQRYRRVTNDKTKGTGLGLAISKEFVEAQGGRIWVESTPGEGSCFFFSLPIDQFSASVDVPSSKSHSLP